MSLLVAVILSLFFTNSFISKKAHQLWEPKPVPEESLKKSYDFGIILASPAKYDAQNGVLNLSKVANRVFAAIDLYERGKIKKIIVSGGSGELVKADHSESSVIKDYLLSIGIPRRKIITEDESRNTHENAKYTVALIDSIAPDASCLLITTAVHMKRSWACFYQERHDYDVYPVGHFVIPGSGKLWDIIYFDHDNLLFWDYLIHEIAAYYMYALWGYV